MPEQLDENLLDMKKTVNIEGLELLSLKSPVGSLTGIWELGLQEDFHHSQNG